MSHLIRSPATAGTRDAQNQGPAGERQDRRTRFSQITMFGLLNVNKPGGITSRRVVDGIQRLVAPCKSGHAGTLDPLATGVLLVCIGRATRLVPYLHELSKHYRARFRLGCESETDDVDGQVRPLPGAPEPSRQQLARALPSFRGELEQRPPRYSAVKVHGRRAYELARGGTAVRLEKRAVLIHSLSIVDYCYPDLTLDICCGSGTYVRALGRDLAASLGTRAVLAELERTAIGDFTVAAAVRPETLTAQTVSAHLLPPVEAVRSLPAIRVTGPEQLRLAHGRSLLRPGHGLKGHIAALSGRGQLLAILAPTDQDQLRPVRGFQ